MGNDFRLSKQRSGTQGSKRVVKTAAATLLASESGAMCYFATAAGYTYTLPPAERGLWFEFEVVVTITSVAAKVICATGDFLLGSFEQSADSTYTTAVHDADGTTILAISMNGTTTGGYKNDSYRMIAISDSQWVVSGKGRATGSEATPFATS